MTSEFSWGGGHSVDRGLFRIHCPPTMDAVRELLRIQRSPTTFIARVLQNKANDLDCTTFFAAETVLRVLYDESSAQKEYGFFDGEKVFLHVVTELCEWNTVSEDTEEDPRCPINAFFWSLLMIAQLRFSEKTCAICLAQFTPSVVENLQSICRGNLLSTFFENIPPLTHVLVEEILPLFPDAILFEVLSGDYSRAHDILFRRPEEYAPPVSTPMLTLLLKSSFEWYYTTAPAQYLDFFIRKMPTGFLSKNRGTAEEPFFFGTLLVALVMYQGSRSVSNVGSLIDPIFRRHDGRAAGMWNILDTPARIDIPQFNNRMDSIRGVFTHHWPSALDYFETLPTRTKNAGEE